MKKAILWFLDRLQERSTWLGLVSLVTAFGCALTPGQSEAIIALGLALGGAVAIFSKDKDLQKKK